MYAIIETGGKQYRVEPGEVLDVEMEAAVDGDQVRFDRVLFIANDDGSPHVGNPLVAGAAVTASLVAEVRGPKIKVFKKKRRKGYKRLNGHRQDLHRVRIGAIAIED